MVMAMVLEEVLLPVGLLTEGVIETVPKFDLLKLSMGIGLIEELCKFLPLALFIYGKRYFNEHTDGVIYFAAAGLGFGLPENIIYTLEYGAGTGILRMILTPFFHAATTAVIGYFLVRTKISGKSKLAVPLALLAIIIVHGLYDFGAFSGQPALIIMSLMITLTLSVGIFLLYMRATERDQALGMSAVGNNSFCRNCGFPNPERKLYCTRCGRHA